MKESIKYKFLTRLDLIKISNQQRNDIRRVLDEVEKLVFTFKIKDNPVLERLKKEDWIVGVHNKVLLSWANKYTLDIIRIALLGEELKKQKEMK